MMLRALAAGVALATAVSASGEILVLSVSMSGLQEVPPNASPGSGEATVTVDTVSGAIDIVGTFFGLVGIPTAAHLHGLAPAGANAGVIFGLTLGPGSFSGSSVLSATHLAGLLDDLTYINLHSTFFPGGELRGQVIVPAPAAFALLALTPMIGRRRRA